MRVLLAGASGAIGLPLIRQLVATGHEVVALHRRPESHARLVAAGAAPIRVDVLDRTALLTAVDGQRYDAVISQLTAMKKAPLKHKDMTATNRLRTEGTANLLAVAQRVAARRFVSQSMVFGYGFGDFGGRVLTEDDPFAPPGIGRFEETVGAMRTSEKQVLEAGHVEGIALRYGLFYGPGPAGDTLVDLLRRRRLPVIRNGGVQPWVYIEDAASATVAALEGGRPGSAYNIADDEPVSFADMMTATAAALEAPKPRTMPSWLLATTPYAKAMMTGGLRVSSTKAKNELSWTPTMPNYRYGIPELAKQYPAKAA